MKYEITYRNRTTRKEYSLVVPADDYNQAVKIAKEYRGENEDIASVELVASSVFEGILNSGLFGRAGK